MKHYVDHGHDAPDPGSPSNQRILALLDEAVSRGDSACRTLDAVDLVLSERPQRRKRAVTALDGPLEDVAREHAVGTGPEGARRRHARPSSRARADARSFEKPREPDLETGHERSTCGEAAHDDAAQEKVA